MQWVCGAGRVLACRVLLLDEREQLHDVQANKSGQALLDAVFRQLDLVETSYFGLRYLDEDNQPRWLEARRRLARQLRGAGPHTLYLAVKFYAADPCRLLEEITRYQVFLQVRQDVARGRLPVPPDLAPQLAAYVLQSELGDYDPRRHPPGYVSEFRLQPGQTPALEARAAELHRSLAGQTPAAAELGYLERAKWLELYGADLHPVLGEDSVEYFLGLAPSGVLVLRNKRAVASYYWPRITKLYSKGKYFMLRVCDKNNEVSTYGFETPSRGACRHLWRCCSEQHAFFRLQPTPSHTTARNGRQVGRSPPTFTRVPSRRLQRRPMESVLQVSTIEVRDAPEIKPISIPQPALSLESPYRSTCSIPAALGSIKRADSPRSTRSAPFPRQGMYSGPPSPHAANSTRLRSSSLDSHSSNDSRSCRRHRHRSRRTSDAESEASRGSGRSRRRRRHRSRHKGRDSADETDSRHRSSTKRKEYELVESGGQWQEAQRKQAVGGTGAIQQASVRRAVPSEISDPSQSQHRSSHRHRRHRKHRSRSRSPSETKSWLPSELKQHLEWDLVETDGMSAAQLREIPYTVVQTSRARQLRLKQSNKHRDNGNDNEVANNTYSGKTNNMDYLNSNGGSIRSISSTISSGRNGNSKLSERRNKESNNKDTASSGPVVGELRSGRNVDVEGATGNPTRQVTASASNSSSGELISSARVSHEHTDSGLGADQDYAYSSERYNNFMSSDSAKCPASGGTRQHQINTPSVSSLRPLIPYSLAPHCLTPHSLSADLASLSLTRQKPPINPAVNKHYVQPSNTSGLAYKYGSPGDWVMGAESRGNSRLGRGRAGGSLRSLASVQSEGRATLNKHRGPLYYVRSDATYAFNRHASNNNFIDSGIFVTGHHRQNGGSLRNNSTHHGDYYKNSNRSNATVHSTFSRQTDNNANVKRHGGHTTDNSLHIILKPLIESTQLQGN